MRVFLWDGTIHSWSLSSLTRYGFTDLGVTFVNEASFSAPLLVYPNPTSDELRIRYWNTGAGDVRLEVLNSMGELVSVLHHGPSAQGPSELVWDGRSTSGLQVRSGTYQVRLVEGGRIVCKQVVVQR